MKKRASLSKSDDGLVAKVSSDDVECGFAAKARGVKPI
jgi:hypothetical protein